MAKLKAEATRIEMEAELECQTKVSYVCVTTDRILVDVEVVKKTVDLVKS